MCIRDSCERGDISFYDKVMNVQNSGGVAALIYNNEPGNFYGTLGDGNTSEIMGLSLSQEDGQFLVTNKLEYNADLVGTLLEAPEDDYQAWDGTSMATPHVSAVAALLWSAYPNATNAEIREAMTATARDLGDLGRDVYYGYGLVQAYDALQYLSAGSSGPLAANVYTDKLVYSDREIVTINAQVFLGIKGIEGADVTAAVTTADGDLLTFSGQTDVNGDVAFTFKAMTNRFGAGQYQVEVTASYPGYADGTAEAVFVVNKK